MSLILPHTNSWGFVYTNQAVGSVTPGTSVTPGASDDEGSFTEFGPDASITTQISYMTLVLSGGATSGQSKPQLLDVYYDPAGGTSYTVPVFDNLVCGGSNPWADGANGRPFHFPCSIPAGAAVAARIQGANATPGTVRVLAHFYGKPSRPELWRAAAYSETLGYTSGTLGTSFTPGSGTFGAWASLGTTAKKHFWAQLGVHVDNSSTNDNVRLQLGIGDGTNMHVIIDQIARFSSTEDTGHPLQQPCTWEIPAGATLYVRGAASTTPATGYNATAVLFGG